MIIRERIHIVDDNLINIMSVNLISSKYESHLSFLSRNREYERLP